MHFLCEVQLDLTGEYQYFNEVYLYGKFRVLVWLNLAKNCVVLISSCGH